jgi:hypothetical protein
VSALGIVKSLAALAALAVATPALAQGLPPNELGKIMVLEYHKIDYPEERWTRTPENFRRDLETLYARGFRLQSMNGVIEGKITVPAGTTPVVLTFDDSSPGQFRYVEKGGTFEIDPKSGVGILEAFIKEKPDFGRAATFYVLPGASKPNKLFNQPEHEGRKLQFLAKNGYEIGNHTLWHANLGKYGESTVRDQVGEAQVWVQRHVPDYKLRTLALPHGVYPKDLSWIQQGTAKGTTYRTEGVLMVAGGAAPSPFARTWDPMRIPRIQAVDSDMGHWLKHFEKNPRDRYVSDGDPSTLTIPAGSREKLKTLPSSIKVVER